MPSGSLTLCGNDLHLGVVFRLIIRLRHTPSWLPPRGSVEQFRNIGLLVRRAIELRRRHARLEALRLLAVGPGPLHIPALRRAECALELAIDEQRRAGFFRAGAEV